MHPYPAGECDRPLIRRERAPSTRRSTREARRAPLPGTRSLDGCARPPARRPCARARAAKRKEQLPLLNLLWNSFHRNLTNSELPAYHARSRPPCFATFARPHHRRPQATPRLRIAPAPWHARRRYAPAPRPSPRARLLKDCQICVIYSKPSRATACVGTGVENQHYESSRPRAPHTRPPAVRSTQHQRCPHVRTGSRDVDALEARRRLLLSKSGGVRLRAFASRSSTERAVVKWRRRSKVKS